MKKNDIVKGQISGTAHICYPLVIQAHTMLKTFLRIFYAGAPDDRDHSIYY